MRLHCYTFYFLLYCCTYCKERHFKKKIPLLLLWQNRSVGCSVLTQGKSGKLNSSLKQIKQMWNLFHPLVLFLFLFFSRSYFASSHYHFSFFLMNCCFVCPLTVKHFLDTWYIWLRNLLNWLRSVAAFVYNVNASELKGLSSAQTSVCCTGTVCR